MTVEIPIVWVFFVRRYRSLCIKEALTGKDFDYEFDFSTIDKGGLGGTTVTVIEKSTGNRVWTMHI